MSDLARIALCTVAAFVISGLWYTLFGRLLATLHPAYREPGGFRPTVVVGELVRTAVVVTVVAAVVERLAVAGPVDGALLGLVLWLGFPAAILAGSVLHEKVPVRLAAVHAGDWLVKLVTVTAVLAWWP